MSTYNLLQQVFCLGMLSNAASLKREPIGVLRQELAHDVAEALSQAQHLLGDWQVLWGPQVYNHTGNTERPVVVDNAMYVVRSTQFEQPVYVVAIAGTNPNSWYGWFMEDFRTGTLFQKKWPYAEEAGKLSNGTSIGLSTVMDRMTNAQGQTVVQWLKEYLPAHEPAAAIQLYIAGHSLGGALSSTMALALLDTQAEWDVAQKVHTIVAAPTAGATPGNREFAEYAQQRLAGNFHGHYNSLDFVPHAWQDDMLAQIPNLYAPHIPKNLIIEGLATLARAHVAFGNYQHIQPYVALPGKYSPEAPVLPKVPGIPEAIRKFLGQAGYQHVGAYFELMDVLEFQEILKPFFDDQAQRLSEYSLDLDIWAKSVAEQQAGEA